MGKLLDFQRALSLEIARRAEGSGRPMDVLPAGRLTPSAAVEVYRRAYVARLTEALGGAYEAVWRIMGDEDFFSLCERYVAEHPSRSHNLSDYGDKLAEWMAWQPCALELPFLPDLARFEWMFQSLFHLPQHPEPPGDLFASLASSDGESLSLCFAEAALLFDSPYSIYELWKHRQDDDPPDIDWKRAESLLLFKRESQIRVMPIGKMEYAIILRLMGGTPIGTSLAEAEALFGAELTPLLVSELFSTLAQSGVVTALQSSNLPLSKT